MNEITIKYNLDKPLEIFEKNSPLPFCIKTSKNAPEGSQNVKPKTLLLTALGGCTALDIVALLRKMRLEIKNFEIKTSATLSESTPSVYTEFRICYCFNIEGLPSFETKKKLKKIVELSQEQYCSLSQMLRKVAPIKYAITINGHGIETCACKF
ncbi:MAG: OsmC family protein [Rikenellaceae bacterium]